MRVKYSSLPEVRLEMIELTRSMSHWSLRLKSWSRVLLKERESMWWSWRVAVEVEMESGSALVTVERDSDSSLGYEKVACAWSRKWFRRKTRTIFYNLNTTSC